MSVPDLAARERVIISHLERATVKADHSLKQIASQYVERYGLHRNEIIFEKILGYEREFWDKIPEVLSLLTKWIDNVAKQLNVSSSTIFARTVQHQCWTEWLTRLMLDPWLFDPEDPNHPACHAHANSVNNLFVESCRTIVYSQFSLQFEKFNDATPEILPMDNTMPSYHQVHKQPFRTVEDDTKILTPRSMYNDIPQIENHNRPWNDTTLPFVGVSQRSCLPSASADDRRGLPSANADDRRGLPSHQYPPEQPPVITDTNSYATIKHRPIMLPPSDNPTRDTQPSTFKVSGLTNNSSHKQERRRKNKHKNSRSSRRRSRSTISDDDSDSVSSSPQD